tara:strand:+ start:17 stop:229 length:213 start_codon:yes stop_codon:yes gene_type:complete
MNEQEQKAMESLISVSMAMGEFMRAIIKLTTNKQTKEYLLALQDTEKDVALIVESIVTLQKKLTNIFINK